jgi:hypothetical protein
MGRSAQRSAGARATLTGGSGAGQPGGRTVPSADGRAGQIPRRLLAAFGAEHAVRLPMGRDLGRPLNGTFAALSPQKAC